MLDNFSECSDWIKVKMFVTHTSFWAHRKWWIARCSCRGNKQKLHKCQRNRPNLLCTTTSSAVRKKTRHKKRLIKWKRQLHTFLLKFLLKEREFCSFFVIQTCFKANFVNKMISELKQPIACARSYNFLWENSFGNFLPGALFYCFHLYFPCGF